MKIVTIGGGTGIYQLLRSLQGHDITAIVSMADNGGSSGILRDEYGVLPPGDIRKSLIALSNSPELMKQIFSYRFAKGGLKGHNLGNLIITALTDITGSQDSAIKEASSILNINGTVLPVTLDDTQLHAKLEDGTIIKGETHIDVPKHNPELKITKIFLEPDASGHADSIKAMKKADYIIIGPGDLYTSILPNLLVKGIPEAIRASDAKKVFMCNIMTKHGETTGFRASDFFNELEKYQGKGVLDLFIINDTKPSDDLLDRYKKEHSEFVEDDTSKLKVSVIKADLLNESDILRHDPEKLKQVFARILP